MDDVRVKDSALRPVRRPVDFDTGRGTGGHQVVVPVRSCVIPLSLLLLAACSGSSGTTESPPSADAGAGTLVTGSGPTTSPTDGGTTTPTDAAAPPEFWDASGIPNPKNVMIFKFLNRSNGAVADTELYWQFKSNGINELHSFAQQPTYDMPANASGRMYFFVCKQGDATCAADPTKSKYYDFIEHTIGAAQYNGNTTRVDAFGLKIALKLHAADGFEEAVGEDYGTFAESRDATFARFLAEVPVEFAGCVQAPYRIVEPGGAGFNDGAHKTYYTSYVDQMWAANGISIPKPGPNGSGLAAYPDLSAAIFRHVGAAAGTFDASGKLLIKDFWTDSTKFYPAAPADYYARFWHAHGLDGKAYGFPYDDVGGYSTYVSHKDPRYMLVAVGW